MENGTYKSDNATYFVKDDNILMLLKGNWYKTSLNFFQGIYKKPLTDEQLEQFDEAYAQVNQW